MAVDEIGHLLAANRRFAEGRARADEAPPRLGLAVVTCMDARIDTFAALGLQVGELAFRVMGPLATAIETADREPFKFLKSRGINLGALEGKIDGQLKMTLPVSDKLQMTDVKTEGRIRLTDGRLKQAVGQGKPASSPEVQALATTFLGLISQFTRGDAEVEQGLATYWQQQANLPPAQKPPLPWGAPEQALLEEAVALQKK